MNIFRFTACILAFVLAAEVAFGIDLAPSKDNTIFQNSSSLSGGGEIGIFVGANNLASNPARRGLIQFDVAGGLPPGVTITDASLTLALETANNATAHGISLYRLGTDWGEGTAGAGMLSGAGFTAADGDATWTEARHNQVNWTAGGNIATPASATLSIAGSTPGATYTWASAGLLNDVKNWYANPATNFGWDIVNSDEAVQQSVKTFYSREFATISAFQPRLTITYVPEPAALGLAVFAGALCLPSRKWNGRVGNQRSRARGA
jgi:hypothetical protein